MCSLQDSPLYDPDRCHVFQNDLTKDSLNKQIEPDSIDIASMIFVLSAIHPDKMVHALCNIWSVSTDRQGHTHTCTNALKLQHLTSMFVYILTRIELS